MYKASYLQTHIKFASVSTGNINLGSHLVAKLPYNSKSLSVRLLEKSGGNVIFSAPIQDKQLKFLVKIPMTYAHLIYTLFCSSVCYLGY